MTAALATAWQTASIAADGVLVAQGAGGNNVLSLMLPFLAIGLLFYFLLIRPQRREETKRRDMLATIKKNDHVVTAGGIYGVVTNVHAEADEVTIKVDESTNTKLRMTLSSITRVVGVDSEDESKAK